MTGLYDNFKSAGSHVFNAVKDGINSARGPVGDAAHSVITGAKDKISGLADDFKSAGKHVFNAVKDGISSVGGDIKEKAGSVLTGAKDKIGDFYDDFKRAGKHVFNAVKNGIGDVADDIKEKAKSVISGAKDKIGDFADDFFDAGKNLIESIGRGIASAAGAVVGKVKDTIRRARDLLPFSEPKDKSSPLYGLKRSGQAIVGNIVSGITADIPVAVNAVAGQMMAPITTAAKGARIPAAAGGGTVNNISRTYNIPPGPAGAPVSPEWLVAHLDRELSAAL